jgi:hypothetical protein
MEEGTSKAIPLRRSRTGTRAVAVQRRRWTEPLTASVRFALQPPRQVWLATLGCTALTLRTARDAWARIVAEGTSVEHSLWELTARIRGD